MQLQATSRFYINLNAEYEGVARDIQVPTQTATNTPKFIGMNLGIGFNF